MNRFLLPGAALWGLLAFLSGVGASPLGLLELLFLLAPWVLVPLGLSFVPDSRPVRIARLLQPAAARAKAPCVAATGAVTFRAPRTDSFRIANSTIRSASSRLIQEKRSAGSPSTKQSPRRCSGSIRPR